MDSTETRIAVILPVAYRGGTLRLLLNVVQYILSYPDSSVVLGLPRGHRTTIQNQLKILHRFSPNIEIRDFDWRTYNRDEATSILNSGSILPGRFVSYEYYLPVDGEYKFLDCNAWLFISDRIANPLLPLKPYGILVTDHLQRYVPEIFPKEFYESSHSLAVNFLRNIRNANLAIATSHETLKDLRSYSGARGILLKLPTAIDSDYFCSLAARESTSHPTNREHSFFIWVTNTTQHKNHLRTIRALDGFLTKQPSMGVVITGTNTDLFQLSENSEGPNGREPIYFNEYVVEVRSELSKVQLRHPGRIRVLGEVSDTAYLDLLSNAQFLLHNVIADNGTYSVIEAALMGTPSISSYYPQMIEIDRDFELNLRFFNPYSVCDLEDQLLRYESLTAPNPTRTLDLIKRKHFSNWGDTLMNTIRSMSREHPMTIQAL